MFNYIRNCQTLECSFYMPTVMYTCSSCSTWPLHSALLIHWPPFHFLPNNLRDSSKVGIWLSGPTVENVSEPSSLMAKIQLISLAFRPIQHLSYSTPHLWSSDKMQNSVVTCPQSLLTTVKAEKYQSGSNERWSLWDPGRLPGGGDVGVKDKLELTR